MHDKHLEQAGRALAAAEIPVAEALPVAAAELLRQFRTEALDFTSPHYIVDGALSGEEIAEMLAIALHGAGINASLTKYTVEKGEDVYSGGRNQSGNSCIVACTDHAVAVVDGKVIDPRFSSDPIPAEAYNALMEVLNKGKGLQINPAYVSGRVEIATGRDTSLGAYDIDPDTGTAAWSIDGHFDGGDLGDLVGVGIHNNKEK